MGDLENHHVYGQPLTLPRRQRLADIALELAVVALVCGIAGVCLQLILTGATP